MNPHYVTTAMLLASSLFAATTTSAAAGEPTAPVSPDKQRQLVSLVRQDCGSCHGMTLKGGLGKPLLPSSLKEQTASALAQIILTGVPGTPMPPWQGLLSKSEALWIATHLKNGTIARGNIK